MAAWGLVKSHICIETSQHSHRRVEGCQNSDRHRTRTNFHHRWRVWVVECTRVTMCKQCDRLAPYLRVCFPQKEHPHVYECHYTYTITVSPSQPISAVEQVTDTGALAYLSSGGDAAWCEQMSLRSPSDTHGLLGAAPVLAIKQPFGSGYFIPMRTTGDGNCLVHAASRGIYGVEMWHVELRNAMTRDFDENRDWYVVCAKSLCGQHWLLTPKLGARRYVSRIQIADNKTKDEALAQFYHVRDECQTNHAVRAVFAACAVAHPR